MSTNLNPDLNKSRNTKNAKLNQSKIGIPALLGSGDDAQNSIVYSVIKWTFIVGFSITFIFTIYNFWIITSKENDGSFLEQIKSIWAIFIPLITLSLGYLFGKNQN